VAERRASCGATPCRTIEVPGTGLLGDPGHREAGGERDVAETAADGEPAELPVCGVEQFTVAGTAGGEREDVLVLADDLLAVHDERGPRRGEVDVGETAAAGEKDGPARRPSDTVARVRRSPPAVTRSMTSGNRPCRW
jgi:hypothetical protein